MWNLFVLNSLLEGAKLLVELPGVMLGKTWTKKCILKFLECSMDTAGLLELNDEGLGGGLFYYDIELSITHVQV